MLTISRAGYTFGWTEMMKMPIRHLIRYEEIGKEVIDQEKRAYEGKT